MKGDQMKLTGIEKLEICAQALSRPTLLNRYRFWRYVEGCGCFESAVKAVFRSFRQGD